MHVEKPFRATPKTIYMHTFVPHDILRAGAQTRRRRATGGKPPRVSPKALYTHINVPPEILRARECRPTYMTKPPTAHAVRIAMRIRAKNYSLTAPAVSPLTIYLTRKKYRTTIGTATNTEPAAKRANSVSPRLISPTATV